MNENEAVKFRMVLEMVLPDASPTDSSGYIELLEKIRAGVERNPQVKCTEVVMREVLRVPAQFDDYSDWRHNRGEYDYTKCDPSTMGHIEGINFE